MRASLEEQLTLWREFTSAPIQQVIRNDLPGLLMLRLDLIKSWTSGNKYFKLKYAIESAIRNKIQVIVSKGGMFSNHLAALAEACKVFQIQLIAVIRSYAPDESNPSIRFLCAHGVEIKYVSPEAYQSFNEQEALSIAPDALFIPEGGLSPDGVLGAAEIVNGLSDLGITHIVVSGGTMGTACGIISSAPAGVRVIVVPAWKGCSFTYIAEILLRFAIEPKCTWELWSDYHFGGFGRFNPNLIAFMSSFSGETHIQLDPVYTGKMMYAIDQKIKSGYFTQSDRIMAIHTGGLQGMEGFKYRFPETWGKL